MFLNDWEESKLEGLIRDFDINQAELDGVDILFADYTYEAYNGDAFVVFTKEGKIYEVNAGHCSCYGLEGQWNPEETSVDALIHRIDIGHLGWEYDWDVDEYGEPSKDVFASKLKEILLSINERG